MTFIANHSHSSIYVLETFMLQYVNIWYVIWYMCDLVLLYDIWYNTWSSWWCTHDLEHICRCDLVWYFMIWVYDTLAHLVEILYHFYENYMPSYTNIIPRNHETCNPSEFWAIPVLDNALVPCYARLVHKSLRHLIGHKRILKGSILRTIINKHKKQKYIYKGI